MSSSFIPLSSPPQYPLSGEFSGDTIDLTNDDDDRTVILTQSDDELSQTRSDDELPHIEVTPSVAGS